MASRTTLIRYIKPLSPVLRTHYRSLTNSELASFADFQETQAGEWFEHTVSKGFEEVISKTVKALKHGLKNLKRRHSEKLVFMIPISVALNLQFYLDE